MCARKGSGHGYPLVRTKKKGRAAITVYAQAHVVTLDDDCWEIFLLDANGGTSMALRGTFPP